MNPREGDMRAEWDCRGDCVVYAEYREGAWNVTRRVYRYDNVVLNEREYRAWATAGGPRHPAHFRAQVYGFGQQVAPQQNPQNDLAQQAYWNGQVQQARWINDAQNAQNALYQGQIAGNYVVGFDTVFTTRAPSPEAVARAKELLLSHLDSTQKAQFEAKGDIEIIGGSTKRIYRVASTPIPGKNVTWMENGKPRISYDAHPVDTSLPAGDIMLAQKLALENPEMEVQFTRIACKHDHNANPYDVDPTLRYYRMYEQYARITQAAEPARPTILGRLFGA